MKNVSIEITAQCVHNIDPHERNRITVGIDMSEAQVFEAIDTLLDAGGPQKRKERIAKLLENELNGMTA
jgi:hypothetical protein